MRAYKVYAKPRGHGHEFAVPNMSVWRNPWGVYLRTRRWRVTAGPLFGWKMHRAG